MSNDDDRSTARTAPPDAGAMPMGTALELLAAPRRRFALYALTDASQSAIGFEALVERVADLEARSTDGAAGDAHPGRIARDLHYWHLPVLADVGVAEYDERSRSVRYRGDRTLDRWLERARRDELPEARTDG